MKSKRLLRHAIEILRGLARETDEDEARLLSFAADILAGKEALSFEEARLAFTQMYHDNGKVFLRFGGRKYSLTPMQLVLLKKAVDDVTRGLVLRG